MASKRSLDHFPLLRLQCLGSIAIVQPVWEGEIAGRSLTCDLETGTIALAEYPPIDKNYTNIFGVIGLARFEAGPALIVITGIEEVATLRGYPLYRITSTQVLVDTTNGKWKADDHRHLALLKAGTDPNKYAGSLYYSHGGGPTLNHQAAEQAAASNSDHCSLAAWKRADQTFFWNDNLARPLLESGMDRFVPTLFLGFVKEMKGLDMSTPHRTHIATITLIARRAVKRAGCRQWRRGISSSGDVANFAETEQIVTIEGLPSGPVSSSFVQVRGSIPILWSQAPNLKYKIPIRIAPSSYTAPVFAKHVDSLLTKYKKCVAINLANQTGREGKLSNEYKSQANQLEGREDFRLVAFDFHKHCGATNYAKLAMLWGDISTELSSFGYWFKDNAGTSQSQNGVFRVNCVDSLDRTNVVAGGLARRQVEHMLSRLGILPSGGSLATTFPAVDAVFRVAWADHGDELSQQYAGTGAMKSAFTRTGKRDTAGLIDDGVKSLTRYFLNNFRDGAKQDAIDLVTGACIVSSPRKSSVDGSIGNGGGSEKKKKVQGSPAFPLLAAATCFAFAVSNARHLGEAGQLFDPVLLMQKVVSLLIVSIVIIVIVMEYGERLVDRPTLRPDLVHPWE